MKWVFICIYVLIYLYLIFYASTRVVKKLLDSNLESSTRITRVTRHNPNFKTTGNTAKRSLRKLSVFDNLRNERFAVFTQNVNQPYNRSMSWLAYCGQHRPWLWTCSAHDARNLQWPQHYMRGSAQPDGRPLGGSELRSYFSPLVHQRTPN